MHKAPYREGSTRFLQGMEPRVTDLIRRRLFKQIAGLCLAQTQSLSAVAAASSGSGWALLGTQTGEGIYRARWDS